DGDHHGDDDHHSGDHHDDDDHSIALTCTAVARYTPNPNFYGRDTFTFTVSDGRSTSAPATVCITVTAVNDPPTAGADSISVPAGAPFQIDPATLLANHTPRPPNEPSPTLKLRSVAPGTDAHGTVSFDGDTVTYTPDVGFSGLASFSYVVCDNGLTAGLPDPRCAVGVVSVLVTASANVPPVGEPLSVRVAEDS